MTKAWKQNINRQEQDLKKDGSEILYRQRFQAIAIFKK
jgi:hypothetical protein